MKGSRNIQTLLVFFGLIFATIAAQAEPLVIKCPTQDYSLAGNQNGYYFIKGSTLVVWKHVEHTVVNKGRFLSPGQPPSLTLSTLNMDIETYDAGKGVSFYCNLADASNTKVAFATGSFLLKDLGISGMVTGCAKAGGDAVCDVV